MSSQYLMVSSSQEQDPANFNVGLHTTLNIPKYSQIRLINCRLNLRSTEILINDTNNILEWGLGKAPWSETSSFGLFTATLPNGTYLSEEGTTDLHITHIVEEALNASAPRYLRGGFSVSLTSDKQLTITLSTVSIPNYENASSTYSKWHVYDGRYNGVDLFSSTVHNKTISAGSHLFSPSTLKVNGITIRGKANHNILAVGQKVVVGECTDALFLQAKLSNIVASAQPRLCEVGLLPELLANREANPQGNIHNFPLSSSGVRGLCYFQIYGKASVGDGTRMGIGFRKLDKDNYTSGDEDYMEQDGEISDVVVASSVDIVNLRISFLAPTLSEGLHRIHMKIENASNQTVLLETTRSVPTYLYSLLYNNTASVIPYVYMEGQLSDDADPVFKMTYTLDDYESGVSQEEAMSSKLWMFGDIPQVNGYITENTKLGNEVVASVGEQLGFVFPNYIVANDAYTTPINTKAIKSSRQDVACYYLDCPSLPVSNYSCSRDNPSPNTYIGIITLHQKSTDELFGSERHTDMWIDLNNSSPLSYNNLTFRIVNFKGEVVMDIDHHTILNLQIRQDPAYKNSVNISKMIRENNLKEQQTNKNL